MRPALALLALLAVFAGCRQTQPPDDAVTTATLDPALRQHLATVSDTTLVDVLVGTGPDRPADIRRGLEAVGLEVRTVAGTVAVGRGVRAAVVRAAGLAWVEQIDLSQDRPLFTPRP